MGYIFTNEEAKNINDVYCKCLENTVLSRQELQIYSVTELTAISSLLEEKIKNGEGYLNIKKMQKNNNTIRKVIFNRILPADKGTEWKRAETNCVNNTEFYILYSNLTNFPFITDNNCIYLFTNETVAKAFENDKKYHNKEIRLEKIEEIDNNFSLITLINNMIVQFGVENVVVDKKDKYDYLLFSDLSYVDKLCDNCSESDELSVANRKMLNCHIQLMQFYENAFNSDELEKKMRELEDELSKSIGMASYYVPNNINPKDVENAEKNGEIPIEIPLITIDDNGGDKDYVPLYTDLKFYNNEQDNAVYFPNIMTYAEINKKVDYPFIINPSTTNIVVDDDVKRNIFRLLKFE